MANSTQRRTAHVSCKLLGNAYQLTKQKLLLNAFIIIITTITMAAATIYGSNTTIQAKINVKTNPRSNPRK